MSEQYVWDWAAIAGTDLSAKQFFCVKLDTTTANTVDIVTDEQDTPFGIVQNNPTTGHGATVRILGESKAISDGSGTSIAAGDFVGTDDNGRMVKKATNDYTVLGQALDPSTALGTVIRIMMTGKFFYRTPADS